GRLHTRSPNRPRSLAHSLTIVQQTPIALLFECHTYSPPPSGYVHFARSVVPQPLAWKALSRLRLFQMPAQDCGWYIRAENEARNTTAWWAIDQLRAPRCYLNAHLANGAVIASSFGDANYIYPRIDIIRIAEA